MSSQLSRIKNNGKLDTEADHHFKCDHCHARCTRAEDGTEYGHHNGCPDRPPWFKTGESSVGHRDYLDIDDTDAGETVLSDGGQDDDARSIAREHLLGATIWAYGGGSVSVKPWVYPSNLSRFWRVRR